MLYCAPLNTTNVHICYGNQTKKVKQHKALAVVVDSIGISTAMNSDSSVIQKLYIHIIFYKHRDSIALRIRGQKSKWNIISTLNRTWMPVTVNIR